MIDDQQQAQPWQPVGIDDAPGIGGADFRAALGGDQHAAPFHAAAARLAESGDDPSRHRPRQLAPDLRERLPAGRRRLGQGPAQVGNELLQPPGLAFQARKRVLVALDLPLQRSERPLPLRPRRVHRREFLLALLLEHRQAFALGLLVGRQRLDPPDRLLDLRDAPGAGPAKIRVVDEHAAERRGILLAEQQLQVLLLARDIGGAQLGRQLLALRFLLAFPGGAFRCEVPDALVAFGDPLARRRQALARGAHLFLRFAQLRRKLVLPGDVVPDRPLQRLDLLLHPLEVGLRILRCAEGRHGQQDQERQCQQVAHTGKRGPEGRLC